MLVNTDQRELLIKTYFNQNDSLIRHLNMLAYLTIFLLKIERKRTQILCTHAVEVQLTLVHKKNRFFKLP